jgi:hypothetical protein
MPEITNVALPEDLLTQRPDDILYTGDYDFFYEATGDSYAMINNPADPEVEPSFIQPEIPLTPPAASISEPPKIESIPEPKRSRLYHNLIYIPASLAKWIGESYLYEAEMEAAELEEEVPKDAWYKRLTEWGEEKRQEAIEASQRQKEEDMANPSRLARVIRGTGQSLEGMYRFLGGDVYNTHPIDVAKGVVLLPVELGKDFYADPYYASGEVAGLLVGGRAIGKASRALRPAGKEAEASGAPQVAAEDLEPRLALAQTEGQPGIRGILGLRPKVNTRVDTGPVATLRGTARQPSGKETNNRFKPEGTMIADLPGGKRLCVSPAEMKQVREMLDIGEEVGGEVDGLAAIQRVSPGVFGVSNFYYPPKDKLLGLRLRAYSEESPAARELLGLIRGAQEIMREQPGDNIYFPTDVKLFKKALTKEFLEMHDITDIKRQAEDVSDLLLDTDWATLASPYLCRWLDDNLLVDLNYKIAGKGYSVTTVHSHPSGSPHLSAGDVLYSLGYYGFEISPQPHYLKFVVTEPGRLVAAVVEPKGMQDNGRVVVDVSRAIFNDKGVEYQNIDRYVFLKEQLPDDARLFTRFKE